MCCSSRKRVFTPLSIGAVGKEGVKRGTTTTAQSVRLQAVEAQAKSHDEEAYVFVEPNATKPTSCNVNVVVSEPEEDENNNTSSLVGATGFFASLLANTTSFDVVHDDAKTHSCKEASATPPVVAVSRRQQRRRSGTKMSSSGRRRTTNTANTAPRGTKSMSTSNKTKQEEGEFVTLKQCILPASSRKATSSSSSSWNKAASAMYASAYCDRSGESRWISAPAVKKNTYHPVHRTVVVPSFQCTSTRSNAVLPPRLPSRSRGCSIDLTSSSDTTKSVGNNSSDLFEKMNNSSSRSLDLIAAVLDVLRDDDDSDDDEDDVFDKNGDERMLSGAALAGLVVQ